MEDTVDWLTEKQLIVETGEGKFSLDRLRRAGLIPWGRRFLRFGLGTCTVYPPIAIAMIRRIQELPREGVRGYDRWCWALWREGYPADIVRWLDQRLHRLEKLAEASFGNGKIKIAIVDVAAKGRLRRKPHQPIFNKVRDQKARQAVIEWSLAIGVGCAPPASFYDRTSPTVNAFRKAVGAEEPPDPLLEIEKMSFARLRELATGAPAGDFEKARLDYNRLTDIVRLAASLDWRRVRDMLGVTHQGGPATPMEPFERLIGLWDNLDFRAVLVPFLMFVRSRPGYRYELDERFASMEVELQALSQRVRGDGSAGASTSPHEMRPARQNDAR